ncbi:Radial spoke head protein [Apis cerana cerana]|uniref:Radial spoke head protein n=1 Tax=Apis cerana cerana TaxID=94128 RepID=A0A2A3EA67_APICC|nr:Radial spoke head protein [Apis cerana cerana]
MPAGISALAPTANGDPFVLEGKSSATFTILRKGGLDATSPPVVRVDDEANRLEKSNPTLEHRRRISRSNDHLAQSRLQSNQANPLRRESRSRSEDDCRTVDQKIPAIKPSMTLSTEDFNEVLNAKLRKLQEQEREKEEERKRGARKSQGFRKKPFITTVKTGEKPEVRHSSHIARCPTALKATVDFTLGMMNATTMAASTTLDDRTKIARRNDATDQRIPFGNIMFDRRVVRGSTFAATPVLIDGERSMAARQAEARRRNLARKRAQALATKSLVARAGSPPPVPGRKHEPVQTEIYLEELLEKPDEVEVATQTDYFLDKPLSPKYCPQKVGEDASTQIEPGDLFDFDFEVQPILEILVGKTIEQALMEVLEEEEIAALKEQQRKFLELRAMEKAETRRLEEQERRLREEKDQRLKQYEDSMIAQRETEERIAAATLLTGYIAELLPAVLEGLKMSGFLLDEIKADVEDGFMPWLMREVKKEIGHMVESREVLMGKYP